MWIFPPDVSPSRCRACGERIFWAFTERFAKAPINDGFKILDIKRLSSTDSRELIEVASSDSHFSTCPFAERFKKLRQDSLFTERQ